MNNLDILRAFAVLAVYLFHLNNLHQMDIPFFGTHGGWFGVQLFFLLSGYLIIQSAEKYSLKTYLIHRVLRIYPAYLVAFLGVGWLIGGFSLERITQQTGDFFLNIFMLQHFSEQALHAFDSLHVTWTLTIEVLWYLLAPFMVLLLRRAPNTVLLASFALSTTWVYLASHMQLDALYTLPPEPSTHAARWLLITNAFPAQLCFFVLGAYVYYQREWLLKLNTLMLTSVLVILLVTWPLLLHKMTNPGFLSGVALAALLVIALQTATWHCRMLKWIADISYSLYLLHVPVLLVTYNSWGWRGLSGALGAFALVVLVASLSYLFIEKPAMRWARRFS